MYRKIQEELSQIIAAKKDFRLMNRRPNIGMALKQILDEKRISMKDLIHDAHGLNRNFLNNLIRTGEVNTGTERFVKLIQALGVSSDEFMRVAREASHYNFYRTQGTEMPRFTYPNYEVEIYSPPSFAAKDFLWCFVRMKPGKHIPNLLHETMHQVAGFVTHGCLGLKYGDKNYSIHTNQCFFFDPKIQHSFLNEAPGGTTEFYLLFQLKAEPDPEKKTAGKKLSPTQISASSLIEQIRKELSPDPNQLLPMPALAHLSGIGIDSLTHLTYRNPDIIPFEKIESLASLTDYSFDHIIQKSENRYQGWVRIFTDQDKVAIDLSARYGVRFMSHAGVGIGKRRFSIADIIFDSWNENQARKEWRYQGIGFVGISVQRGRIGVQYGKQPPKTLSWGDRLYFNADVEITLSNMLSEEQAEENGDSPEAKATLFAFPPIV